MLQTPLFSAPVTGDEACNLSSEIWNGLVARKVSGKWYGCVSRDQLSVVINYSTRKSSRMQFRYNSKPSHYDIPTAEIVVLSSSFIHQAQERQLEEG